MKLTRKSLLMMLARAEHPAPEQVVAAKLARKTIGFNKEEHNQLFPKWPGLQLKVGKTVEVVRGPGGVWKVELTDAAHERLSLGKRFPSSKETS